MIKELTELVALAEHTLPNHEALLNFLSGNSRDVLKLYHVMQVNKFRTEAEAIEKAGVGERTKFRQVARELLRCLEQMVLHIGFDKQILDDLNHGRARGFQLMAITKSLGPLACKHSGKKAAEELLRLGKQYGRPEFVLEAVKALMDYVPTAGDELKDFDQYLDQYLEYEEWRKLEERAFICLNRLNLLYAKKKALQYQHAAQARQYVEELEDYVDIVPSHNFHLYFYCLKAKRFMIEANYAEASRVYDRAIEYFRGREYPCNGTLSIFYYLEIANCVILGRHERGRLFFQNAMELAFVGSVNWFNTLELGFYLRMHERDYTGAAELYHTALRHKRFQALREAQRESWQIFGAYLYIMHQLSNVELPEGMAPKLKSSKFRNSIRNFSQDKTGMNIAVLAAEVLLDFVEGKSDELWDRIAALEKYRERYLRNSEETHRSQLFIKILTILSKYNYDRGKFLEKAEPYLSEMRKTPLQLSSQAHELEIVPYEHLIYAIAGRLYQRRGGNPVLMEGIRMGGRV